jgi:hypothetical protein
LEKLAIDTYDYAIIIQCSKTTNGKSVNIVISVEYFPDGGAGRSASSFFHELQQQDEERRRQVAAAATAAAEAAVKSAQDAFTHAPNLRERRQSRINRDHQDNMFRRSKSPSRDEAPPPAPPSVSHSSSSSTLGSSTSSKATRSSTSSTFATASATDKEVLSLVAWLETFPEFVIPYRQGQPLVEIREKLDDASKSSNTSTALVVTTAEEVRPFLEQLPTVK